MRGGGKTLNNIIYPIGSVVIRVDSQNPSYWYGGTWELLCPGRTMVCIDTSDSNFNTVKKTGGEKTHTLTIEEMPSHNHNIIRPRWSTEAGANAFYGSNGVGLGSQYDNIGYQGGNQSHNNLQPYMVVYIWVRIA